MPKYKSSVRVLKNTKEKDRQTQVKVTFALMNVLLENDWMTKEQIVDKLRKKGYERCKRTVTRLMNMLRSLKFNVMCNKEEVPYTYKADRRNPFV